MTGQGLFVLPTSDSLRKASSLVRFKKRSDVCVVFKLPAYVRGSRFPPFSDFFIRRNRIRISLPGIGFKPSLEFNIEFEAVADNTFEEIAVAFAAPKVFFDY
jgi:hypothetical protein